MVASEADRGEARSTEEIEQHSLTRAVVLHLFPGALLTLFIVLAAPLFDRAGIPLFLALFVGIGVVIAPAELGYLALYAKRHRGSWSPLAAVDYDVRLPAKQLALWGVGLMAWFMLFFIPSTAIVDPWLADNLFGWMPEVLTQFAEFEGEEDETISAAALGLMVVLMFGLNGFVGPVTEELYFRGHLLPRLERYGRWAPVLNTVLFSLYHFWTPWGNPARILGFLPMAWVARRKRSAYAAMAGHVLVNNVFLLLLLALVAGSAS